MAKIIYHNDPDGWFAATVALHSIELEPQKSFHDVGLFPINYGEKLPLDSIEPEEEVVMLDFAPDSEDEFLALLNRTQNVIWIDHHKSAIEKYESYNLKGIRSTDHCAAVLAWGFYKKDADLPYTLELVEDHDLWRHKNPATALFTLGSTQYDNNPKLKRMYNLVFGSHTHHRAMINEICEKGAVVKDYLEHEARSIVTTGTLLQDESSINAFLVNYNGTQASHIAATIAEIIRALTANSNVEFCVILYSNISGNRRKFELRKGFGYKDVDLSTIAARNGGGGHKDAAGFIISDGQKLDLTIPERSFKPFADEKEEEPEHTEGEEQESTDLDAIEDEGPQPEPVTTDDFDLSKAADDWTKENETITVNEADLTGETPKPEPPKPKKKRKTKKRKVK
uniref:Putative DHH phosphatase family protein n=1 Tax=viral metagenome TaxID=1070528 RepID=A0A6M3IKC7_9ZZZZ